MSAKSRRPTSDRTRVLSAYSLRMVAAALLAFALHGCSALMMSGGGGYKAPVETCSSEQEAAGHCKNN